MKRLWRDLFALFLLLASTDAWATTRWVSPTGDGGVYTFATPGGLDSANIVSDSSDVVILLPGNYSTDAVSARRRIDPSKNGGVLAGHRITYLGLPSYPESVTVATTVLTKRYISIKGVTVSGDVDFNRTSTTQYAYRDSMIDCRITNSLKLNQAKECKVLRVNVTGGTGNFEMKLPATPWEPGGNFTIPENNRVLNCTMSLGSNQTSGNHVVCFRAAQHDTVDSCTISITLSPSIVAETDPFIAFYARWCVFRGNTWSVNNLHNSDHLFRMRDSSQSNLWDGDHFTFTGLRSVRFSPNSSGTFSSSCWQNKMQNLVLKGNCSGTDALFKLDSGPQADTIQNCAVFNLNGPAFQIQYLRAESPVTRALGDTKATSLVAHNTFVGMPLPGANVANAVAVLIPQSFSDSGRFVFRDNIMQAVSGNGPVAPQLVSWNLPHQSNDFTTAANLHWNPGGSAGQAIYYDAPDINATYSAPGTGGSFALWKPGVEVGSLYADPLLTDVSYSGFDPTLRAGSPARSKASDGQDIGVNAAAPTPAGDLTRPYAITDFMVSGSTNNRATFTWTATGDDSLSGTCASYDIRYSTAPITNETEWGAATTVSGEPTPRVAGSAGEQYILNGLTDLTTYYVTVRAVDEAGNYSAIYSSVCVYTPYFCED